MLNIEEVKKNVAARAAELISDGMTVGIGSGTTASYAIEAIGKRVRAGLRITAVAASFRSEMLARRHGITLIEASENNPLDIALDGADEVDTAGNLTKGGGGSLLREKIIAYASQKFYVMVDQSKMVRHLGKFPLPVEIVPFSSALTLRFIRELPCQPVIRRFNDNVFMTDNGNLIADCDFGEIKDPTWLDMRLKMIPGVIETGLFPATIVTGILIGNHNGTVKEVDINP
jgi:ribose 5-phosphate isomerase A